MNETVRYAGRSVLDGIVLVTGATGFLGSEIVRQMLKRGPAVTSSRLDPPEAVSHGSIDLDSNSARRVRPGSPEVHVLARSSSDRSALEGLEVCWHAGDLGDAASIDAVLSELGQRARETGSIVSVVHCAALVSYKTADRESARVVNVEGTRALLAAARRHGIARFAFVSSVVAIGHGRAGEILDERAPFNAAHLGVDYIDTKRAAEELVLLAANELDVVVVNPGVIFGPVDRISNTVRFIREIALGRSPLFAPPGHVSVVGVEDAAVGTLQALERGRRGERYLLVESYLGTHELLNEMARRVDGQPVRRRLSTFAWRVLAVCAGIVDRVSALERVPPQALRTLGIDLCFDAAKARSELGWRPEPFAAVLDRTIEHMRTRGLLKSAGGARSGS